MRWPGATARVLLALAAGAIAGLVLAATSAAAAATAAAIAQPIGRLWLSALQMTVVPLVLSLVILGVANAANAAASGRVARRAMVVFIVLLSLFSGYAALAAPAVLAWVAPDPQLAATLQGSAAAVEAGTAPTLAQWIGNVIPSNAIMAAAQGAMLPLVVFALFFGFALTRIAAERRAQVTGLCQAIADTMIVIVHWVLLAAPLGVFALMLAVCAQAGLGVVGALAGYIGLQCGLYLGATAICYLLVALFAGRSPLAFARAALPVQVVAASTQSSLATLPAMLESARERLHIPRAVAGLVLPMAVTLFRITSPIQYVTAACFVAWAYGIELTPLQLAAGAALAVVISLGSVGLPGQVSFMATVLPVTQSMGLPVEPLGLLLAVDTIPDVFATTGNVTGDLAAAGIVSRHSPDAADADAEPKDAA
ncbi:dicarboxylate/amino acid:cation symporter [Pseudoxanthomonas sp. SGNA-20]|uniref:dicarboxylate/amino acid:cation symporter n=1 Tax=unclassified Pseudoxanthomonas TaxID=2645906 RepID=UPI0002FBC817|nr:MULTISPECIES: dicarboxylate/amino acid:cation symporter [unclassified Pseudoxanthomonas]RRN53911.1 dicarboxylate/amino acid:cation symporter [Pseudoxanthomonas sp. SGNA-20]